MSRFTPNRPENLVASIVALAEQSNRLALDAAMAAARADADGHTATVVDQICRLAVGVGVSAGEIVWLVTDVLLLLGLTGIYGYSRKLLGLTGMLGFTLAVIGVLIVRSSGAEVFAARLKTAEAAEAFTAFAERRAPDFSKFG